MSIEMAENIYTQWCTLRRSIGKKATAFTEKRQSHILGLLEKFYGENILLVVHYLKSSDDLYAKFMRGENDKCKDYTGFDNIFRSSKMEDKIERAINWEKTNRKDQYNDGVYFPYQIVEAE